MIHFSPPFINQEIIDEVTESLKSGWITTGPKVRQLEAMTAELAQVENVLCVNSATSGLMLALHWFGIGKGDEVIVPAYTYAATALAVMHVGATPVMADVNEDFNIDSKKIRELITEKTKAIMPVDIAGLPCSYDEIFSIVNDKEILKKFIPKTERQKKLGRLFVLSDSAHSVGAVYKNKPSGSISDISIFSFHAVKNVTTAEGGAICLNLPSPFNNKEEYDFLRLISLNGQTKDAFTKTAGNSWKYDIVYQGFKINMPDVLAAIAITQMKIYKSEILKKRKKVFDAYNNFFLQKDWALIPPSSDENRESSYHVYLLRIKNITEDVRDKIMEEIYKNQVAVNVHFQPLPILTLFKEKGYKIEDYPVSYKNYAGEISLPIYPQLSDENVKTVCNAVESAYNKVVQA